MAAAAADISSIASLQLLVGSSGALLCAFRYAEVVHEAAAYNLAVLC